MQFLNQLILTIPDRKASITESLKLMAEGWGGIFIVIAIMMLCILALNKAFSGSTKKLSKTSIALIAGVLVVATALLFVFSGAGSPSAKDTAESFMEACVAGDEAKASELSCGKMKTTSGELCKAFSIGIELTKFEVEKTEAITDEGEIDALVAEHEIDREIEKAELVHAEATLKFAGEEQTGPMSLIVCRIDGEWYVVAFSE